MDKRIPESVEGISILPKVRDTSLPGRDFTITTVPFANPGDTVDSVDNIRRRLGIAPVTTVTMDDWSLLYSVDAGLSQLYHLPSDPLQQLNVIEEKPDLARQVHERLVKFMKDTNIPGALVKPRTELRI